MKPSRLMPTKTEHWTSLSFRLVIMSRWQVGIVLFRKTDAAEATRSAFFVHQNMRCPVTGHSFDGCEPETLEIQTARRLLRRPARLFTSSCRRADLSILQPAILLRDLRFDEFPKKNQRCLPTQIAGFGWDDIRDACLVDMHFRSAGDLLQRNRHFHPQADSGRRMCPYSEGVHEARVRDTGRQ